MSAAAESLSGGQRQAIAIARAVYHTDLRVLVMDEPTAALGPQETERTLNLIATLKAQGLAIILISHSLDDVFASSDRVAGHATRAKGRGREYRRKHPAGRAGPDCGRRRCLVTANA